MALAMAAFTCNDALVKILTGSLNVGQIMLVRGIMTAALVYGVTRWVGTKVSLRELRHPMVLLRTFFEISSTLCYLIALSRMPLANISAILQSLPLAVTLGAALFLGEPVGWRRWSAIIIGFIGVLIIVQPGPEGFTTTAVLALLSMFGAAARDLTTRKIPAHIPSLAITVLTTLTNSVFGLLLIVPMGGWQPLDMMLMAKLAAAAVLVFIGYQTIVLSMRYGDISFIAPFRYTSLLWALTIGFFVFGSVPQVPVLIGAAIVIASGLYTFYREHQRSRIKPAAGSAARPH